MNVVLISLTSFKFSNLYDELINNMQIIQYAIKYKIITIYNLKKINKLKTFDLGTIFELHIIYGKYNL